MTLPANRIFTVRRATAAQWAACTDIPEDGRWCMEIDTGKFKIGNGADAFTDRPYQSGTNGTSGANGAPGDNGNFIGGSPDGNYTGTSDFNCGSPS